MNSKRARDSDHCAGGSTAAPPSHGTCRSPPEFLRFASCSVQYGGRMYRRCAAFVFSVGVHFGAEKPAHHTRLAAARSEGYNRVVHLFVLSAANSVLSHPCPSSLNEALCVCTTGGSWLHRWETVELGGCMHHPSVVAESRARTWSTWPSRRLQITCSTWRHTSTMAVVPHVLGGHARLSHSHARDRCSHSLSATAAARYV